MVDLVIRWPPHDMSTYPNAREVKLRVQRKDKKGSRGTYLELHDLNRGESVKMQAAAGNRIKVWFIGRDEKQLPGTGHEKRTITEDEGRGYRQYGLIVAYYENYRGPYFRYDPEGTVPL
jgi:hypothetical protein